MTAPILHISQPVIWSRKQRGQPVQDIEATVYALPYLQGKGRRKVWLELPNGDIEEVYISAVTPVGDSASLLTSTLDPFSTPVWKDGSLQKTFIFANNAGGIGKTGLSTALAYLLAQLGLNVLFIDGDRQANATTRLGHFDPVSLNQTIYPLFVDPSAPVPTPIRTNGVDLIPACWELGDAEGERAAPLDCLAPLRTLGHDVIIIDSAPALGVIAHRSAIIATDSIYPVPTNTKGLDGLGGLAAFTRQVRVDNPTLGRGIYVPTMHTSSLLAAEALELMQEHLKDEILLTPIRRLEADWERAAREGKPVNLIAPNGGAAKSMQLFLREFALAQGLVPPSEVKVGKEGDAA